MPESTRIPSYRLHKSSGQAVVTLGGRDHYLGKHSTPKSQREYNRLIAKWLVSGRALPADEAHLTVIEVVARYWQFATGYYSKNGQPNTEAANIKVALRYLRRLYGHDSADAFGPRALKAVREAMVQDGHSRGHVNKQVARIRRLFRWAVESELVPPSVYHGLQAVTSLKRGRCDARETEPVRSVPDEFVAAIKPHVSKQIWSMVELQRLTGMRSGEVVIIRGRDLDMTGSLWLFHPEEHKTQHFGHERIVELGPRGQAILTPFLNPDLEAFLFSPIDATTERNAARRSERKSKVQPSQRGRLRPNPKRTAGNRYTPASYRRAIQRACDAADTTSKAKLVKEGKEPDGERVIPRWHPHQLRHNYATRVRREYGIETARILLGHRSVVATEIYAEADRMKAREIVAKIG